MLIEALAYRVNATFDYVGSMASILTVLVLLIYLKSRRDDR